MPRNAAQNLIRYLERRAGSHLRAAAFYTESDYSILYIKDDVDRKYSEREFERIADRMRSDIRPHRAEQTFELGEFNCSLWAFEKGVVIHFPQGSSKGTIITLEPEAARQFKDFIGDCAERIYHT